MSEALQQEIRRLRALEGSRRDPRDRIFLPLADAHLRLGSLERARELLEDGLTRHPDFVCGHVLMARLLEVEGDSLAAEERWATARRLDPENSEALLALGRILLARGEPLGAQLMLEARAMDPTAGGQEPDADLVSIASLAPDARSATEADVVSIADLAPDTGADVIATMDLAPTSAHPASSVADPPESGGAAHEVADELEAVNVAEASHPDPRPAEVLDEDVDVHDADDPAADPGAAVERMAGDEMVVDEEPAADELTDGKLADEEPAADELTGGKLADEEPAADELTGGKLADEEPVDDALQPIDEGAVEPDESSRADRPTGRVVTRTLAELFVGQGQRDRAIEMYEELTSRSPDDAALRERLEELRSADGREPEETGDVAGDLETNTSASTLEVPAEADAADQEEFDPRLSPAAPEPEVSTPFAWTASGVDDDGDTPESDPEEATEDGPISDYLGGLLGYAPDPPSDDDPSRS